MRELLLHLRLKTILCMRAMAGDGSCYGTKVTIRSNRISKAMVDVVYPAPPDPC